MEVTNLRTHVHHIHGDLYKPEKLFYPSYLEKLQKKFVKKTQRFTKRSKENETMLVEINYCK